ncbi:DUF6463 family protein [Streptomyces syringium]|uniref:DUF6463 family protein n=1 Tax=Streptomyces syringium TaxID=76729 RepID=UPI0037D69731
MPLHADRPGCPTPAVIGPGLLARRLVTTTGTLPAELGWILLALRIPVSLLEPVSGGWSLIVIGLAAVLVSRRDRPARRVHQQAPPEH